MDIQYHGANCVSLSSKNAVIVVDDQLISLGLKSVTKADDVALFTRSDQSDDNIKVKLFINQPGDYEVSDIFITGIAAKYYKSDDDKLDSTIYKIVSGDVKVLIVGHVYPELSGSQLEAIGETDVMIIPVGGNGYTLSGDDALKLIKKVEPNIVIPTHYADSKIQYPISQLSLQDALKELAMEPSETVPKLKLKAGNFSDTDTTKLIVLERE